MSNTSTTTNGSSTHVGLKESRASIEPHPEQFGNRIEWLDRAEDSQWDAFVAAHPHGTVCQTTHWREMVEESFPHIRARALVIRDGVSGEIRAGLMAYTVHSWLLGNRLVSVPFASRVDPLVSVPSDLLTLLDHLKAHRRDFNTRSLQIRLLKVAPQGLPADVTVTQNLKRHYLPLAPGADEIYKQTHASCVRRWIKKASREGVTVRAGRTTEDWDILFNIYAETRQRLRLPVMPRRFFTAAANNLKPEQWELFIAEKEGVPLGAGLFLIYNGIQQLEWVGDTAAGRAVGANQKLYWTALQDAVNRGCHTFCFGRTDDTNEGLLDYKRRWGSIEEDIAILVVGAKPGAEERRGDTGITRRVAQKIIDSAPRPLYLGFSEFCYRHLG